jgi:hypothetical protein
MATEATEPLLDGRYQWEHTSRGAGGVRGRRFFSFGLRRPNRQPWRFAGESVRWRAKPVRKAHVSSVCPGHNARPKPFIWTAVLLTLGESHAGKSCVEGWRGTSEACPTCSRRPRNDERDESCSEQGGTDDQDSLAGTHPAARRDACSSVFMSCGPVCRSAARTPCNAAKSRQQQRDGRRLRYGLLDRSDVKFAFQPEGPVDAPAAWELREGGLGNHAHGATRFLKSVEKAGEVRIRPWCLIVGRVQIQLRCPR